MNATSSASGVVAPTTLIWQRVSAIALGVVIVGFVGFSQMQAVHDAGHDYRHSMAFPCH